MYILFVTYVKYEMMRGLCGTPVNLPLRSGSRKDEEGGKISKGGLPGGLELD